MDFFRGLSAAFACHETCQFQITYYTPAVLLHQYVEEQWSRDTHLFENFFSVHARLQNALSAAKAFLL